MASKTAQRYEVQVLSVPVSLRGHEKLTARALSSPSHVLPTNKSPDLEGALRFVSTHIVSTFTLKQLFVNVVACVLYVIIYNKCS